MSSLPVFTTLPRSFAAIGQSRQSSVVGRARLLLCAEKKHNEQPAVFVLNCVLENQWKSSMDQNWIVSFHLETVTICGLQVNLKDSLKFTYRRTINDWWFLSGSTRDKWTTVSVTYCALFYSCYVCKLGQQASCCWLLRNSFIRWVCVALYKME